MSRSAAAGCVLAMLVAAGCETPPDRPGCAASVCLDQASFAADLRFVMHTEWVAGGLRQAAPDRAVHWDITEGFLLARGDDGQLAAAFRIDSHFDLGAGPERPWAERRFLRVDWGQNLVARLDLADGRHVSLEPIDSFVADPGDPRAPQLGCRTAACPVGAPVTSIALALRALTADPADASACQPGQAGCPQGILAVDLRFTRAD